MTETERKQPKDADQPLSLDDLFKKTTTEPPLYYLPLTDEQAEARLKRKEDIRIQKEVELEERNRKRALEAQSARARIPYRRPVAHDRLGIDRSRERRNYRAYRR